MLFLTSRDSRVAVRLLQLLVVNAVRRGTLESFLHILRANSTTNSVVPWISAAALGSSFSKAGTLQDF